MRILVDGSELADEGHGPSFWQATLPSLIRELKPDTLFLLNRPAPHVSFQLEKARILNAPPINYLIAGREDRRLAALCAELKIDLFISTGYASAGGKVASCLVATDSMKEHFNRNPELPRVVWRSSRLASVHIATSESSAQHLHAISELEMSYIRILSDSHSLSTALMDSFHSTTPEKIGMMRERAEQHLQMEAQQWHDLEQVEAQEQWQLAVDNFGKLPLIPRLWRAIRNVRRYPEYIRRMLRLGSKAGGVAT